MNPIKNKNRTMTIMCGGGLNVVPAIEDALLDGWKSLDGLLLDNNGIIGWLPENAKYLRFQKA